MARGRIPERPRWRRLAGWVLGAVVLLALFPPFHIRPRGVEGVPLSGVGTIDVPGFAARFWSEKLLSPAVLVVDARVVVAALVQDPVAAAQKYGRRAGIGGKTFFLVSGAGRVVAIDPVGAWIEVQTGQSPRILLLTGPVFGNALRDVTGLLRLSDYSSVEFNSLSTELDHLAEIRAQPALRKLAIGASLAFLAAGEIDDASQALPVLRLAPIRVEGQP